MIEGMCVLLHKYILRILHVCVLTYVECTNKSQMSVATASLTLHELSL